MSDRKIIKSLKKDEAHSLVNLPNINKEELDAQIGEPPWMGKRIIDNLRYTIFDIPEVILFSHQLSLIAIMRIRTARMSSNIA